MQVIGASQDRIAGFESVQQLAQSIPHAVFEEMQSTGHLAPFEKPGEWRRILLKFLLQEDPL